MMAWTNNLHTKNINTYCVKQTNTMFILLYGYTKKNISTITLRLTALSWVTQQISVAGICFHSVDHILLLLYCMCVQQHHNAIFIDRLKKGRVSIIRGGGEGEMKREAGQRSVEGWVSIYRPNPWWFHCNFPPFPSYSLSDSVWTTIPCGWLTPPPRHCIQY